MALLRQLNVSRRSLSFSSRLCSAPVMPPCDYEPPKYEGPSRSELVSLHKQHINPVVKMANSKAIVVGSAFKQWIWDEQGKRYLDLFAGVATLGVGHRHPKVFDALVKQANKFWHTTSHYLYPQMIEYANKLANTFPGDLKVCYFVNSGGEATDLALTMARVYSGMNNVITIKKSYHGVLSSQTGISACSSVHYDIPQNFATHNIMCPDVYRGLWGGKNCRDSPVQTNRDCDCKPDECKACDMYLAQLEDELKMSLPNKRAGIFLHETIQGYAGAVQFPKNFLKKAYELVRANGGVCVADEIQNGFGRTGTHFWGFEGAGVMPDIVTTAKSIANGFPFAAVVTTPKIAEAMLKASYYNTFGGNPMAASCASAVLDIIKEEKLTANCHTLGTYFLTQLAQLRNDYSVVGDVRGKGLMIGVDLVDCKEKRTPLPGAQSRWIMERLQDYGILVGLGSPTGNVLRIKPPMCITRADVDFSLAVLRRVLEEFDNKFLKK